MDEPDKYVRRSCIWEDTAEIFGDFWKISRIIWKILGKLSEIIGNIRGFQYDLAQR